MREQPGFPTGAWRRARCGGLLTRRRGASVAVCLAGCVLWSATASAQLDPLLFIKRVPPTVIVVMDTSLPMLEDGNGNFYDPNVYSSVADPAAMLAFPNIDAATMPTYRRVYRDLAHEASPGRYTASHIAAVPANGPAAGDGFLSTTRWAIARQGVASAVGENSGALFRWGLIRLRQQAPAWRVAPNCDRPVRVSDPAQAAYGDTTPCSGGGSGSYGIYAPSVGAPSYAQTTQPAGTVMVTAAANTGSTIVAIANRGVGDNAGFVPAGLGDAGFHDRPIDYALIDARAAASAAMAADDAVARACRNTIVVLITSGKDEGNSSYKAGRNPVTTAGTFLNVSGGGVTRRVPIHVIGVKPASGDVTELRDIAAASGGRYTTALRAEDVAAAIHYAVQNAFARPADFDLGRSSEFLPQTPVVGTVNLKNARDAAGNPLPHTDVLSSPGNQPLSQRSNVLLTSGFSLPGFDGRLRAFRAYRPVPDSTKPIGWKFVSDGTRLWRDLDGRPALAGLARTPANAASRNIYTFIPSAAGAGSVVAFTTDNAAALAPHLGAGLDAGALIALVRSQPLGAIIGSMPALMDPPSLDPPPDNDYGRPDVPTSFAGRYKDRRSIIFVGANDGMIHAIDARTGYEIWAFIPYNLLPKLRTLRDGQPVEQFDYFVDSSPKIAEVKINGTWRSLLVIGQGNGGTFYQAFDVTEAGMGVDPMLDDLSAVNALLQRFDTPNESIAFKWSFPDYASFDPTYIAAFAVSDGTPGRRVKVFGDLRASATFAEKTVGYTWSAPAIGSLDSTRTTNAVIVGSGYFPDIESSIPARGAGAPKAGNALYLLDADTGRPIGNPSGAACSGTGCIAVGEVANGRKNALQADPTAAGENGSNVVSRAFLGDIDGRYWRFGFTPAGAITRTQMIDTGQPIYGSSALLFVGSVDLYMFFATGSDLLAASAPGGTGTFRLYGLKNGASSATVAFSQLLETVTTTGGRANGERPSVSPSVAGDIVFFTTTVQSPSTPCLDATSNLYAMTYTGGAAYDADGNGRLDRNESTVAMTMQGRATAPFIVDQHLYVATTGASGAGVEMFGDPEDFNNGVGQVGVRILSWREIR